MISSKAEYRASDYRFHRQQSPSMALARWEMRQKPVRSIGQIVLNVVEGALLGVFILACIWI